MAMQGGGPPGPPGPMGPLLMGMQQMGGGHPQMVQGQSPQQQMGPIGNVMQQQGPVGMGPGGQPMQGHPGQQHLVHHPGPGQGQGQPPPQQMHMSAQEQPRVDNISRAKSLMPNLQESLKTVLKVAAQSINANNMVDSGLKSVELDPSRFDKSLEEFFSVCDQIEMHLKTSIECIGQAMSSQRYLATPVNAIKSDSGITYSQYISTVKSQIGYAKEVHDALADATQRMTD